MPHRSPSPFIGNGRLGIVIPPLGIGATPSFLAGLYEHAPEGRAPHRRPAGVERHRHLRRRALARHHRARRPVRSAATGQTVDMRSGTARTGYDWVDGDAHDAVEIETFVSRAAPALAATPAPGDAAHGRAGCASGSPSSAGPPPRRLAARHARAGIARLEADGRLVSGPHEGARAERGAAAARRPAVDGVEPRGPDHDRCRRRRR